MIKCIVAGCEKRGIRKLHVVINICVELHLCKRHQLDVWAWLRTQQEAHVFGTRRELHSIAV